MVTTVTYALAPMTVTGTERALHDSVFFLKVEYRTNLLVAGIYY